MRFACPRCGNVVDVPSTQGLVCPRCGFGQAPAPASWSRTPPPPGASPPATTPPATPRPATPPLPAAGSSWAPPPPVSPSSPSTASNPYSYAQPSYTQPYAQASPPPVGAFGQAEQSNAAYSYGAPEPKTDGFAIAGFVCAFLLPLLGIIFSIIGFNRVKKDSNLRGRGLAIAGIIISIANFVLAILLIVRQNTM